MKIKDFVVRAQEVINLADQTLATSKSGDFMNWVDEEVWATFRTAGLSLLRNAFGVDHPYFLEFADRVSSSDPSCTRIGKGILIAAHAELDGGWDRTVTGIVSAEIFSDFLEMSEHLLDEGYKDAAAVMIGSVLEEHLRQLANKNGVAVYRSSDSGEEPKKADLLNAELKQAGVYGKLEHKQITSWFDLRNKAAHGDYTGYAAEEVRLMLQGVSFLMSKVPS